MAGDFENLSIRISASAKDAITKVNQLATALENLNAQLGALDTSKVNQVSNIAGQMGTAVRAMGGARNARTMQTIANSISQIIQATAAVPQAANATEALANATDDLSRATGDASNSVGSGGAANGVKELASSSRYAENVIKSLSAGWSGFTGTLKKVGSIFGNVAKKTLSSVTNLKKLSSGMDIAKKSAAKFAKEITRIGKMLKLMITRMVLRQIISGVGDGFKNLAQYSSEVDAKISLLWNSFRQLGNAIAAAASPLLTAFAPALNYIIQLVISAVNAINQLLSALSGLGTWFKAKTLTDDYAKSLKKAGGAAKELKKTVLGFDELNQLQDNKSSGGGGTSPADMFEKADVSDKWKRISDWLKDMWNKGDFYDLGRALGLRLLEALNNIPWNKIKKAARKIGKSIATLINGFIEVEGLGRAIGKTIAEAINTAFEFVDEFVHRLHWKSLGKFIANTFNGFFEKIDWVVIKSAILGGLKGLADAIQQFIKTFNWDNISKTVVNALDVISDGIRTFFENINWRDLGNRFGDQLKKIIQNTDWVQIGEAIGDIVQAAIDFFAGTIEQLSWSDVKTAIQNLLEGFFNKADKNVIGDAIKVVIEGAMLVGVGNLLATAAKIAFTEKLKAWITGAAAEKSVETAGMSAGKMIGGYIAAGLGGVALGDVVTNSILWPAMEWALRTGGANDEQMARFKALEEEYRRVGGSIAIIKDSITGDIDDLVYTVRDANGEIVGSYKMGGEAIITFADDIKESQARLQDQSIKLREEFARQGSVVKVNTDEVKASVESANKAATDSVAKMREEYARTGNILKIGSKDVKASAEEMAKTSESNIAQMRETYARLGHEVKVNTDDVKTSIQDVSLVTQTETVNMKEYYADMAHEIPVELETLERSNKEVTDNMKSCFDQSEWTFSGVADGLRSTFEDAKNAVKGIWNSLVDALNGEHQLFNSKLSINLPHIYASGGFPEDGLFMANHGELVGKFSNGRTAVANNEQITDGIARAVYSAITAANSGGSGTQYINNTIEIDGVAIARAVTKGQERLNRRYSPTMA